jgi:hypothetical protein
MMEWVKMGFIKRFTDALSKKPQNVMIQPVLNKEYLFEIIDAQVKENSDKYSSGVFPQEEINWWRETFGARDDARPNSMKYKTATDDQIQEDVKYFHYGMAQEFYSLRLNVQNRPLHLSDFSSLRVDLSDKVEQFELLSAALVLKEIDTTNEPSFLQRKAQPDVAGRTDDEIIRIFYHEMRGRVRALDIVIDMFNKA